jgi:dTDP-4-dehydrorhamnose 3,5-epimerase
MEVRATAIPDVKLILPKLLGDSRGFFLEAWNADRYREAGLPEKFVQLNHSRSSKGTLRGMHFQLTHPQGKLVRVLEGRILDVAVDIRPRSAHFTSWTAVELSSENHHQVYLPQGFAHGFLVLSAFADVEYLTTDVYDPTGERCLLWNDPAIGIDWPITDKPLLSEKDQAAPRLEELTADLELFRI